MIEDFNSFFSPITHIEDFSNYDDIEFRYCSVPKNISFIDTENLKKSEIALIGVPEFRASENYCTNSTKNIRNEFYKLFNHNKKLNIYDLGDLTLGKTITDTYFLLRDIIFNLLQNKIVPIIFGGSQDLTFSQFLAHDKLEKSFNIVSIDARLNIGNSINRFNSETFLGQILLNRSSNFLNYTNIGYQTYLVSQKELEILEKLHFDSMRLGSVRQNISETEPILRDADIISFDIASIRNSNAPANFYSTPNGFFPEEACQLMKYAGINDKLSSIGIYDYNSTLDNNNITAKLIAQLIWHYIEGYNERKNEKPEIESKNFKKFIVKIDDKNDFVFYKSERTQRWWIEATTDKNKKIVISCSYEDYLKSVDGDIPERILNFYQKIY